MVRPLLGSALVFAAILLVVIYASDGWLPAMIGMAFVPAVVLSVAYVSMRAVYLTNTLVTITSKRVIVKAIWGGHETVKDFLLQPRSRAWQWYLRARAHRRLARAVAIHGAVHRHHRRHLCRASSARPRRPRSAPFGAILLGVLGRRMTLRDAAARDREHGGRQRRPVRHRDRRQPVLVLHRADPSAGPAARRRPRAQSRPACTVMVLIILGYIVLGCFLEGIGMVLITVPVFQPMVDEVRLRPDLVRHHRRDHGRGRADPSAGRHEPVRHPGAGAGREDHQHLPRHHPVPGRAAHPDRADVPVSADSRCGCRRRFTASAEIAIFINNINSLSVSL